MRNCSPHTEERKKNISLGLQKAYAAGRRSAWNKLPDQERLVRKKIHRNWGAMLHRVLKRGVKKEGHSHEQLGYSKQQLRQHVESLWEVGMSWENYGNREGQWDIDHIVPLSSFPLDAPPSVVNALSNLRPMWAMENLRKSNR